jgi:hypothetical protein
VVLADIAGRMAGRGRRLVPQVAAGMTDPGVNAPDAGLGLLRVVAELGLRFMARW